MARRDFARAAARAAPRRDRGGPPSPAGAPQRPPECRAAATLLRNRDTIAIVTGQQAGAFGGPLFTLLKAITALQLARRTSVEHGVDAVTVFWVDAEDHDWEEVGSVTILDAAFQPRTINLDPPDGAGRLPVAALKLDDRVTRSLDDLQASLPQTDFTEWTLKGLRESWRPGEGMAAAFARWLEQLLGPLGLIVFESADPAAKPLVAELFARELQYPGRTASLAADAGRRAPGTRARAASCAAGRQSVALPARRITSFDPSSGRSICRG